MAQGVLLVAYAAVRGGFDPARGITPSIAEAFAADSLVWILSSVIMALATLIGVGTSAFAFRRQSLSMQLFLRRPRGLQLLGGVAVVLVAAFVFDYAGRFVERPAVPNVVIQLYETTQSLPLLWLVVVVVAPINLEHRQFVLGRLTTRTFRAGR